MRNRRGLWLFGIVIVIVTILLLALLPSRRVVPERTARVRRGAIDATVDALGRVEPVRELALSTRASGPVKAIHVREGEHVSAGSLLLELEATDYAAAVVQAERTLALREKQLQEALAAPSAAEISLARAKLRRATAARLKAQKDYDEIAATPDAESSDEALELETAKLEYEIAKAEFDRVMEGADELQLARLRAEVDDARLALRQARQRLAYTRIEAPFDGTIMRIETRVGENVHGFSPLIWLADLTQLEIRAEIDEIDIASVAEGQEVEVRFDAFPAESVQGRLERLLPGPSDTRGTTLYEGQVRLTTTLPLRPGMGAGLTIITQRVEDTLLIPRRAVRQVGREQIVRVLEGRRQREVVVTTGLSNSSEIEVLAGLSEGQLVLLD